MISSVSCGAVEDPPMTSIAVFRSDRVTNNFAGFPASMNKKIFSCRHRGFKHDVRKQRLPCPSPMNVAAFGLYPLKR